MQTIIITDDPDSWEFLSDFAPIVSSSTYLSAEEYHQNKSFRVINLCKSYNYQTIGYYVSLLAQARDHKALPSVHGIQDVLNVGLSKLISQDIHEEIQHSLHDIKTDQFVLSLYFGQNVAKRYATLAKQLHSLFPIPLIRFTLEQKREWRIKRMVPLSVTDLPPQHLEFMQQAAKDYLSKKRVHQWRKKQRFHDLAILVDPIESNAPSNKKALDFFVSSGEEMGLNIDIIDKNEGKAIAEYDALFIRTTTAVNHYTYRIARRAAQENLVVIDDPLSIIKCTNKVYLAELLATHQIVTPHTVFLNKNDKQLPAIDFPCVLKKPDSAFSLGVVKIEDENSLQKSLNDFFKTSDLVLAQHFIPTEFDWRIGILDNKPLFACRYFMAKDHWQIYDWHDVKEKKEGRCETIPINDVPEAIIKIALKCSKLIGDGLYGVDIKSKGDIHYVIEVNDNPNIDHGTEDKILGDNLYQQIMSLFLQRIRRKHGYV
ncbi:RimK family protein [Legionella sp.]|uniref:RimK family protein n=1 Tax=Legionella sp. TaxID=459 RepID=UPI003CC0E419